MTDGQEDVAVTIGEEICCLLAAGWTWDGDQGHRIKMGVFHKIGKSRHSD